MRTYFTVFFLSVDIFIFFFTSVFYTYLGFHKHIPLYQYALQWSLIHLLNTLLSLAPGPIDMCICSSKHERFSYDWLQTDFFFCHIFSTFASIAIVNDIKFYYSHLLPFLDCLSVDKIFQKELDRISWNFNRHLSSWVESICYRIIILRYVLYLHYFT